MLARGLELRSPTGVPVRPARRSEAVKVLGVDILRDLTLARLRRRRARGDQRRGVGATRRLHHTAVPRAADQPAQHRHHGEAGPPTRLRARRRDPADGRRPGEHVRHSRAAEGRRPGTRDGWELRADGHRGRAAGLRSPGPRGPTGRAADHRGRIRSGLREDRCGARAGQRPAAGWTHGLAAGAARAAGGAHAGGIPPEPDRAVMGGSGRRFVPRLQHRHHLGDRSAGGNRRVASAGRDPSAGAAPVPG